jgi:hypothetical protein
MADAGDDALEQPVSVVLSSVRKHELVFLLKNVCYSGDSGSLR